MTIEPSDEENINSEDDVTRGQALRQCVAALAFLQGAVRQHREWRGESYEKPDLRFNRAWLRTSRKRMELPAKEFAEMLGVSTRTIYNWENGVTRPSDKYLERIAIVRSLSMKKRP